jgi:hypothetical protein
VDERIPVEFPGIAGQGADIEDFLECMVFPTLKVAAKLPQLGKLYRKLIFSSAGGVFLHRF